MSDRKQVTCSCGQRFTTAVRGRGTHCPDRECHRRIYIRVDGTARPGGAAPPDGRGARTRPAKTAPATVLGQPPEPYVSLDEILEGTAPDKVIEARTMWEMSRPARDHPGLSVGEIADEFGVSVTTVRNRIAAEDRRRAAEERATSGDRSTGRARS